MTKTNKKLKLKPDKHHEKCYTDKGWHNLINQCLKIDISKVDTYTYPRYR